MIFKIQKDYSPNNIRGVIDYHEEKVKEGVADKDLSFATTSMRDSKTIENALVDHVKIHMPRKRVKHFHQISCNFNPNDKLNLKEKRSLISDWMQHMGYDRTLHVGYHHQDKDHDHWHVVATSCDVEGKTIDVRNDFWKSAEFSRQLEAKYGLEVLDTSAQVKSVSEKELKMEEYRYAAAIRSYHKENETTSDFALAIDNNAVDLTNNQIRNLYHSNNRLEEFKRMIAELDRSGHLKKSKKYELRERAKLIRERSANVRDFIQSFNSEDGKYYARYVKAESAITYGIDGVYFKDKTVGGEYTFASLDQHFLSPEAESRPELKEVMAFVRKRVAFHLNYCDSYTQLADRLKSKDDIELVTTTNKNGNVTVTYSHKGYDIKGSSINYADKTLKPHFAKRSQLVRDIKEVLKDAYHFNTFSSQIISKGYTIEKAINGDKQYAIISKSGATINRTYSLDFLSNRFQFNFDKDQSKLARKQERDLRNEEFQKALKKSRDAFHQKVKMTKQLNSIKSVLESNAQQAQQEIDQKYRGMEY